MSILGRRKRRRREEFQRLIIDVLMYSEPLCGDMPVSCSLNEIVTTMRERGFEVSTEDKALKEAVWCLAEQGKTSLQSNV